MTELADPVETADRTDTGSDSAAGTSAAAAWDADAAVTALYAAHYRSLVRLSALLLHDVPAAEEVVQDAFVAMHRAWRRLRDPESALAYLRASVVNRSRSALRRRKVAAARVDGRSALPDVPSAEHAALGALEHERVLTALRRLPQRQREVLVLRYYADLSEADIADTLGISRGAVKSHASRGATALRYTLQPTGATEWTDLPEPRP